MRLSQWSNFKLIGDIQVFRLQQCGVQNGGRVAHDFCWIVTATEILEHLGHEFGQQPTVIQTARVRTQQPQCSNFGLLP